MGKYNILLGLDTIFELVHSTLGIIFQDLSQLDEAAMIRRYCSTYAVVSFFYGSAEEKKVLSGGSSS